MPVIEPTSPRGHIATRSCQNVLDTEKTLTKVR